MQQFPKALAGALLAAALTGSAAFGGGPEPSNRTISEVAPTSTAILSPLRRTVELTVGFADLLRIQGNVSTIVLGDPNIADASPLDSGTILLNGRAAGTTNMIVLDESGGVLANLMLYVSSRQPGTVMVNRALEAQVYSCIRGLCEGASPRGIGRPAPAGGTAPAETAPDAAPALALSSD